MPTAAVAQSTDEIPSLENPFEDNIFNIDFIVITGLTKPQLNVRTFQIKKNGSNETLTH